MLRFSSSGKGSFVLTTWWLSLAGIRKTKTLTNKPLWVVIRWLPERSKLTADRSPRHCSAVNLTFLPSISPPPYAEYAQVVIDEGIKVVETAGGPQAAPIIKMYKQAGIFVIHKVRDQSTRDVLQQWLMRIPRAVHFYPSRQVRGQNWRRYAVYRWL